MLKNQTESKPPSVEEPRSEGLDETACCASSDYEWRDIGDGNPVRVKRCPACGVCPGNVDDCGHFGDPDCPYFGVGREEFKRREALRFRHNKEIADA